MKRTKIEKHIEEKTYDIINEIADELNLEIPKYPEVYWITQRTDFNSLGFLEKFREDYDDVLAKKEAMYIRDYDTIIVANKDNGIIAEEAGHFLHSKHSGININNILTENPMDIFALKIVIEMIGYFCSKLVNPKRESKFKDYTSFSDFVKTNLEKNNVKYENLEKKINENKTILPDYFIYKNGYDLGEELFNHYISGKIPKNQIRNLMKNSFKEDFSVSEKVLYLRKKLTRYSYLNGQAKA